MKITRFHAALLVATTSLALAACGGGGDAAPAQQDPNVPPASASASSSGFLAFIASLNGQMFDTSEPLDLSNFAAPSENADAQPPAATTVDS